MSGAQAKKAHDGSRGILTDRRFAAGVLALVVLVFTPLGARMSLNRAVRDVEEQFFTGIDGRGSISDFLSDSVDAALGLISVGANYEAAGDETGELRVDRGLLQDALEGGDISEIANANALVVKSFNALKDTLLSLPLSDDDAMSVDYYVSSFEGAQGAISHSTYNEAVAEFIADTYGRFPARVIGSALGIDPPQSFHEHEV